MKKIILVHFGNWFGERDKFSYQLQIENLTRFLQEPYIAVEKFERLPVDDEMAACDAILFISLSFKKEAKKIRQRFNKPVFVVTGLLEKGDDDFGVIPIDKRIGWHEIAKIIREALYPPL